MSAIRMSSPERCAEDAPTFSRTPPRWSCTACHTTTVHDLCQLDDANATRSVHGHEYRFVTVKATDFFGMMQPWVTKQQSVMVSDKERTVLDALRQPQYAGGIPEVAKALWMSREDIKLITTDKSASVYERVCITRKKNRHLGRLPQNRLRACQIKVANEKGRSHQQRQSSLWGGSFGANAGDWR